MTVPLRTVAAGQEHDLWLDVKQSGAGNQWTVGKVLAAAVGSGGGGDASGRVGTGRLNPEQCVPGGIGAHALRRHQASVEAVCSSAAIRATPTSAISELQACCKQRRGAASLRDNCSSATLPGLRPKPLVAAATAPLQPCLTPIFP